MRRVTLVRLGVALALVAFVYVNNTSLLAIAGSGKPVLLAHRGLHQTFSRFGLKSDTCTAARIDPPDSSPS